jgi:sterol 3beta-glucosyltransferase
VNVAILTLGTRGDVQPYVALGAGLKEAGHEVTLVTAKGFDELVAARGLRYVALDLDLLELARSPEGKAAMRSARGALRLVSPAHAGVAADARRRVGGGTGR